MSAYLAGPELRLAPRLQKEPQTAMSRQDQAKPETYPVSGIMRSHGGHLISEHIAKAFSSTQTPRHLCGPGNLTSLLSAVQSKKALLAMYLSEGGMASSGRTAQFMKALTLMVWRVSGRLTSLRLVQCTKVNSCISSICVLERSTFLSRWQLSQACAHVFSTSADAVLGGVPRSSLKGKETQ